MTRTFSQPIAHWLLALNLLAFTPAAIAQWTAPTDEELKMTSQPEVPGAAAVYLFREEITEDKYHTWSKYERVKVLTEQGKRYATVELKQYQYTDDRGYKVADIQGRTIHPDGTVIAFTGKPADKIVEQRPGFKEVARVFTLPDVEVGSIIEYRYQLEYYDHIVIPPTWLVQSELFTRKAHYLWRPTMGAVVTHDEKGSQSVSSIGWLPVLPKDAVFTHVSMMGTGIHAGEAGQSIMELKMQNIPPSPHEEDMPPLDSLRYRIRFYFTPFLTSEDFWKHEGKRWSTVRDEFIGPGPQVKAAVQQLAGPSDTADQRLKKIYTAVMKLDNTDYAPPSSSAAPQMSTLNEPKTTDDIWERKRGSGRQITDLFVAMARAAGMKAYLMAVTDRSRTQFALNYLSLSQLQDYIAIVNVDGKEQFFDPGRRDCPYGQLAWRDTLTQGLRQTDGGTSVATTPSPSYKESRTQRVANLTLDERGAISGTVKMTWIGAPALQWRETSLREDNASIRRDLRLAVERLLPAGTNVNIEAVQNLEEMESPLIVTYDIKGTLASSEGKRLRLPGDLFESNSKPHFSSEKREIPVYFQYPNEVVDAIRIVFPEGTTVESAPAGESIPLQKSATYSLTTESTPTSITVRRDFVIGNVFYPAADYSGLRDFYTRLERKDHETVVLKASSSTAGGN